MASLGEMVYMDLMARGKRQETARQWRRLVEKFEDCCGAKGKYDRNDVIRFLSRLREQGYRQSSIDVMVRPVKLLAQIQGWTFPRMAMPKVRDSEISRPIFSYEEICQMIRHAKFLLSRTELAYLAFSTTYGLRREELADLKIGDGVVTVDTVKGGNVTTHIMPYEIRGYINGYRQTGIRYLSLVFQRICEKVGMDEFNGKTYGWHAIRRALATELVNKDVSMLNLLRFMRWSDASLRGQFGMVAIYAKRNQEEIDRTIFEVHPFLPIWNESSKKVSDERNLVEVGELRSPL